MVLVLFFLFICGGIMNSASLLMFQPDIGFAMVIASYVSGLYFDLIHVGSTVVFFIFFQLFMLEKVDRIKHK